MTKVFVTTISFNNNDTTIECLESLEKVEKEGLELYIVVVDNASREKFSAKKSYKNFDLEIIRSEINLGFSGGQNLGIKYALGNRADYIIVINNDTIVDNKLIKTLIGSFEEKVGLVVPKIYFEKGYEFHKDRYDAKDKGKVIWYAGGIMDFNNVIARHRGVDEVDKGQYDKTEQVDFASGCCMAVKRKVFEKVGILDDKYFLYYEDNDFSQRAKRAGFKIIYQPKSVLWHKNAEAAGGSGSGLQDYYITRNRLLFGLTYASLRTKLSLLRESLKLLIVGRKWQKIGAIDFYLRKLGRGSFSE